MTNESIHDGMALEVQGELKGGGLFKVGKL